MYGALADGLEAVMRTRPSLSMCILGSDGIFSAGNDIKDFLATASGTGAMGREVLALRSAAAAGSTSR